MCNNMYWLFKIVTYIMLTGFDSFEIWGMFFILEKQRYFKSFFIPLIVQLFINSLLVCVYKFSIAIEFEDIF